MSEDDVSVGEDAVPTTSRVLTSRPAPLRSPAVWRAAFTLAVAVQLAVLYAPRAVSPPSGFPWDKVVHALIFALVAWTGLKAGLQARWLVPALLTHALVSEGIQHWLLPHRSGDLTDAAADAVGALVASIPALSRRGSSAAGRPS